MTQRVFRWAMVWAGAVAIAVAVELLVRPAWGVRTPLGDAIVPAGRIVQITELPAMWTFARLGFNGFVPAWMLRVVALGIGWCGIVLCAAALNEARRVMVRAAVRPLAGHESMAAIDLSRRRFVANGGFGAAMLGVSAAGIKASVVDPGDIALRRYDVPVRGLPVSFDGMRIVQISDTHLGASVSATHVRRAVAMALEQHADLVVLTGDYIQSGNGYIEQAAALFAPLLARGGPRLGVLGVLGNHDFYGDVERVRSALQRTGVRMIDNGRVFLHAGGWRVDAERGAICFAGLGDLDEDVIDVERALGGVADDVARVLLCHQPDTVELEAVRRVRVDVAFCGHTHGGQVRLPFFGTPLVPSRFGSKYAGGVVQGPACPVVVSRGVGTSILPIRWNVPPEVVEVTLRCA